VELTHGNAFLLSMRDTVDHETARTAAVDAETGAWSGKQVLRELGAAHVTGRHTLRLAEVF